MSTHTIPPLVISTTEFSAFKRCRKSFQYMHVDQYEIEKSSEVIENGVGIHKLLEAVGRADREYIEAHKTDPMYEVVVEYLKHRGFPGETIFVEEPLYTLVIPEEEIVFTSHEARRTTAAPPGAYVIGEGVLGVILPAVYIRTTFDRVFTEPDPNGDWIVARDYKSFAQKPTFYIDLDFQGKMQTAALQRYFGHNRVRFEWEMIRQEIGRNLKAGYELWPIEERYFNQQIVTADHELAQIWSETQDVARDLVRCLLIERRFYRHDLKTGPHSCNSCFYKQLCGAEFAQGVLTDQDLELFGARPYDHLKRMTARGIVSDPRVKFHLEAGDSEAVAINKIYGPGGVALALGKVTAAS